MAICYLCLNELNESNATFEHILPNCIGGKLKSKELICHSCNIAAGQTIDAEFCRFFNVWALQYNIRRDKGSIPNSVITVSSTNIEFVVTPGFNTYRLSPLKEYEGDRATIIAGTKKRLLQEIERLKTGLSPNHELRVDEPQKEISHNEDMTFDWGSNYEYLFRSACKICTNYFLHRFVDRRSIEKIARFIKDGGDNLFVWFLELELGKNLFPQKVYHIIHFVGNRKSKFLCAYLELFCCVGFVVILDARYQGDDCMLTYVFDPITSSEIECEWQSNFRLGQVINHIISQPKLFHFRMVWPVC